MAQPKKHSQKLINQAHELAFQGELTNAQIAKKLKLTNNQLTYIIYQCNSTVMEDMVPKSFHVDKAEPAAPKPSQSLILPKEEKTMLAKAFDWLLGT
jgi:hypothetical protein